jgi:glycosyltransferase involved in cell wall biosynthesis
MRILLCSYAFAPSIGGLETVSLILAREFFALGHRVIVVTCSPGKNMPQEGFTIVRNPSAFRLAKLTLWADVVFQNNISLNLLAPALLTTKPIFVTYGTWVDRHDGNGGLGWQDRLKRLIMRRCHNVAISTPIANSLPVKSELIFNPCEVENFLVHRDAPKTRDLVYLGRLNMDKGVDLLIRSMGLLKKRGICPNLTVIGGDVHLTPFEAIAKEEDVSSQITFAGRLTDTRAQEVAKHKIMVIPSRWAEPFGVVALEGIAAGCAVIASSGGGLPEAVGPCGLLYPNGDIKALADAIEKLLCDDALRCSFVNKGLDHIRQFAPEVIAGKYLKLFSATYRG